jgi:NADH:ubiquinone oxidoreductase subunit 5 (subunit L)/multisubunit Na+/H+ antiporter MnhA subunit
MYVPYGVDRTLGIGLPILTFFHLSAHAYFKAIIFICAGGVIHR